MCQVICLFHFPVHTLRDLRWHIRPGINKLVYTERFPAKTENKHRRKHKHQDWIFDRCLFFRNLNTFGTCFEIIEITFYITVILQWWQNQNNNNIHYLRNIVRGLCPCTFELLLSADTTVSSDFLQVYYKNLEPTSTAATEWTPLPFS